MSNFAAIAKLQSVLHKQLNHNQLVDRWTRNWQEENGCDWEALTTACALFPEAKLLSVAPASDAAVPAHDYLKDDADVESEFLWYGAVSNDPITDGHVSLNLPVIEIIANHELIVLSACSGFSRADLDKLPVLGENFNYLTGSSLLARFKRNENTETFYDLNHPTLYIEYIDDSYFTGRGWKSLHPDYRVLQLMNPESIGFKALMFTPHY